MKSIVLGICKMFTYSFSLIVGENVYELWRQIIIIKFLKGWSRADGLNVLNYNLQYV